MALESPLLWVTVGSVDVFVKMFWIEVPYFLKTVLCSNTISTSFLIAF